MRGALRIGILLVAASGLASPAAGTTVCNTFDSPPCVPAVPYPFGQDLRLTVQSPAPDRQTPPRKGPREPAAQRPLNTIHELFAAFEACWIPPPLDQSRPGTEITIRFSISRTREILGEPRFTYSTHDLPAPIKAAYQRAVADAINRCTPFHLSDGLGGAIAGRPLAVRFIDSRGQRRTEK